MIFENKNNANKWFKYTTNWPAENALRLVWFDYGIYCSIEHFNTDESDRKPKDKCLNHRFYNKYIVNVVVRRKAGPHNQVIPFEETLCASLDEAIITAYKYINSSKDEAAKAQIEHMSQFKTKSLF